MLQTLAGLAPRKKDKVTVTPRCIDVAPRSGELLVAWTGGFIELYDKVEDAIEPVTESKSNDASDVWMVPSSKAKIVFNGHQTAGTPNRVKWAPNVSRFAVALSSSKVVVCTRPKHASGSWSAESLEAHKADVKDVCWSPDSTRLASCGVDGRVHVYSVVEGGRIVLVAEASTDSGWLRCIAWDPANRFLVALGDQATLHIWSMAKGPAGERDTVLTASPKIVFSSTWRVAMFGYAVDFSPDGTWLCCTGENDGAAYIVKRAELEQGSKHGALRGHTGRLRTARCSPFLYAKNGSPSEEVTNVVALAGSDHLVTHLALDGGAQLLSEPIRLPRRLLALDAAWGRDGRSLVICGEAACVLLGLESQREGSPLQPVPLSALEARIARLYQSSAGGSAADADATDLLFQDDTDVPVLVQHRADTEGERLEEERRREEEAARKEAEAKRAEAALPRPEPLSAPPPVRFTQIETKVGEKRRIQLVPIAPTPAPAAAQPSTATSTTTPGAQPSSSTTTQDAHHTASDPSASQSGFQYNKKGNIKETSVPECGVCKMCLDKPKFGGPNKLRQRCLQRRAILGARNRRRTKNDLGESSVVGDEQSSQLAGNEEQYSELNWRSDEDDENGSEEGGRGAEGARSTLGDARYFFSDDDSDESDEFGGEDGRRLGGAGDCVLAALAPVSGLLGGESDAADLTTVGKERVAKASELVLTRESVRIALRTSNVGQLTVCRVDEATQQSMWEIPLCGGERRVTLAVLGSHYLGLLLEGDQLCVVSVQLGTVVSPGIVALRGEPAGMLMSAVGGQDTVTRIVIVTRSGTMESWIIGPPANGSAPRLIGPVKFALDPLLALRSRSGAKPPADGLVLSLHHDERNVTLGGHPKTTRQRRLKDVKLRDDPDAFVWLGLAPATGTPVLTLASREAGRSRKRVKRTSLVSAPSKALSGVHSCAYALVETGQAHPLAHHRTWTTILDIQRYLGSAYTELSLGPPIQDPFLRCVVGELTSAHLRLASIASRQIPGDRAKAFMAAAALGTQPSSDLVTEWHILSMINACSVLQAQASERHAWSLRLVNHYVRTARFEPLQQLLRDLVKSGDTEFVSTQVLPLIAKSPQKHAFKHLFEEMAEWNVRIG